MVKMSKADSMEEDMVQMYTSHIVKDDGTDQTIGYAYGPPWIAMALYMGDLVFKTPEEAKAFYEKEFAI